MNKQIPHSHNIPELNIIHSYWLISNPDRKISFPVQISNNNQIKYTGSKPNKPDLRNPETRQKGAKSESSKFQKPEIPQRPKIYQTYNLNLSEKNIKTKLEREDWEEKNGTWMKE